MPRTVAQIAALLEETSPSSQYVTGYQIDSRLVQPGDLFFALHGARVDGHSFLPEAAAKGAVAAVVERGFSLPTTTLPCIAVPNVLSALQTLGKRLLSLHKSRVVAVSGSLGKTLTKEWIAALLKTRLRLSASPGSYNSQATLPLTLCNADPEAEVLVLEMGMNHPGELAQLVSLAPPEVAVITTLAVQHTAHFPDGLAGVAREKAMLFSHPATLYGLYHGDAPYASLLAATGSCRKESFSRHHAQADYTLQRTEKGVVLSYQGKRLGELPLHLPIPAWDQNLLAAVAVARYFGLSWEEIAATPLPLPPRRFQSILKKGVLFIDDACNANPDAMCAALESLPTPQPGGRRIAVLSEMTELGSYSEEGHLRAAESALRHADLLFCLGQRCKIMEETWQRHRRPVRLFSDREELKAALHAILQPGDVVLLKGARSAGLETLL